MSINLSLSQRSATPEKEKVSVYSERRDPGNSRRNLLPLGVDRIPRNTQHILFTPTRRIHLGYIHAPRAYPQQISFLRSLTKVEYPELLAPEIFWRARLTCGYRGSVRLNPELPLFRSCCWATYSNRIPHRARSQSNTANTLSYRNGRRCYNPSHAY